MKRKLAEGTHVCQSPKNESPKHTLPHPMHFPSVMTRSLEVESQRVVHRPNTSSHTFGMVGGILLHHFDEGILEARFPSSWNGLMIDRYDGSIDLDKYVNVYVTQMSLYTTDNIAFYRLLSTSLKGRTLSWLTRPPLLLIDFFDTLVAKFEMQCVISRPHPLTSIALVNILQENGEPLRLFMERFKKVVMNIQNLSSKLTFYHMVTA